MNQTRLFLIFAWLMVAMLLWMEWGKAHAPKPVAAPTQAAATAAAVPRMVPDAASSGIPQATQPQAAPTPTTQAGPVTQAARVHVRTDVLDVVLTGGGLQQADLLRYPQTRDSAAQPVRLLSGDATTFYQAQTGWVGEQGHAAPAHDAAYTTSAAPEQVLAADAQKIEVPFTWTNPQGVTFNRVYTFTRGSYAVDVKDTAVNSGTSAWAGYIYRQLVRVPPVIKTGYTHPESFSFIGATWFDAKEGYQRRPFKDFMEDGPINSDVTGGWLAMPQHHFLTAWVPQADQSSRYSLMQNGGVDGIAARGPGFTLQPGQQAASNARLWVGPKDVKQLNALNVPGMNRAIDYSRFEIFALLGQGLFWLLSKLHALIGNWGWAIIGLVVLLKMVLFPLSNAQYKSSAKMRRVQPRMAQLKERYGDDKVKFQQAMMDLYKTEKINPMGGCLPIIPQMIIFMTLYWVLSEAVELRHAPWMGWIQDLTARDPYFVLPVLNAAIMFATQHMTPVPPGMDPMQQKMMKFMPVIFGGVLAFLPAGLVLYQVANGALGLLQQWYMLRKYSDKPEPKSVVVD